MFDFPVSFRSVPLARKRSIYDQVGEEGLKGRASGGASGYTFQGDPRNIFAQFFGGQDPFANLFDSTSSGAGPSNGNFSFTQMGGSPGGAQFSQFGSFPGMFSFGGGGGADQMDFTPSGGGFGASDGFTPGIHKRPKRQDPAVEYPLSVSLEDLFHGCTKKMRISRKVLSPDGTSSVQDKVVAIDVKPGWKAGTKITFPKEGDQYVGKTPADIVFLVTEKPHKLFTREGNNLIHKARISLRDALCGSHLNVPTIDGRFIPLDLRDVVTPETVRTFPGEGMPISKHPGQRGDLIVKFGIEFPRELPPASKDSIANALPSRGAPQY